jgi:hypothetical protein
MVEQWKYDEYASIEEVLEFIKTTYGAHYSDNQGTQVIDMWKAQGSLETTARDTAQKYLARYGKKDGYNRKDLLKAIHYIILMMHCDNHRGVQGLKEGDRVNLYNPELHKIKEIDLSKGPQGK